MTETADHESGLSAKPGRSGRARKSLPLAAAFFVPFVAAFVVDHFVVGRRWEIQLTDTLPGIAGLGWSWMNLVPAKFDHPGYFFHLLTALFQAVGPGVDDLDALNTFGLFVQFVIAGIVAVWTAGLARRLGFSTLQVFAIGLLGITMPTAMAYLTVWSPYMPYAISGVPVGLGILALADDSVPDDRIFATTFFGIGFLVGVFYFEAIVILAAAAAFVVVLARTGVDNGLVAKLSVDPSAAWRWTVMVLFGLFAVFAFLAYFKSNLPFYSDFPVTSRTPFNFAIGVVLVVLFFRYVFRRVPLLPGLTFGAGGWMLLGWFVSVSVALPLWAMAIEASYKTKSGANLHLPLADLIVRIDVWTFLTTRTWHLALPIAGIIGVVALARSFRRGSQKAGRDLFVGVFILVSLILSLFIAWDVSLVYGPEADKYFGQVSTYYMAAVSTVTAAAAWMIAAYERYRRVTACILVAFAAACSVDYYDAAAPTARETRHEIAALNDVTRDFLARNPSGEVICVRTVVPKKCAVLYAYNYRGGHEELARRSGKDKRFVYFVPPRDCASPTNCFGPVMAPDRPLLIVSEGLYPTPGRVVFFGKVLSHEAREFEPPASGP